MIITAFAGKCNVKMQQKLIYKGDFLIFAKRRG